MRKVLLNMNEQQKYEIIKSLVENNGNKGRFEKTPLRPKPQRGSHIRYKLLSYTVPKNYLFENCGARRAAFKPYFFLSFIRGSLVKKPAFFNTGR